jgi:hypothetical protein
MAGAVASICHVCGGGLLTRQLYGPDLLRFEDVEQGIREARLLFGLGLQLVLAVVQAAQKAARTNLRSSSACWRTAALGSSVDSMRTLSSAGSMAAGGEAWESWEEEEEVVVVVLLCEAQGAATERPGCEGGRSGFSTVGCLSAPASAAGG